MMSFHDMNDTEYQSLMSYVLPPEGSEALRSYLNVVGEALGCRTDAELAREMGVTATSIANWKRRGVVPQAAREWFSRELLFAVASPRTSEVVLNDVAANAVLIALLVETSGNPMEVKGSNAAMANAMALPGLAQLTKLIGALKGAHGESFGGEVDDTMFLPLVRQAVRIFRNAPVFAGWMVDI